MNASDDSGLRVEGLHKEFGGIRAVDGISFEARPGEFVSLLGPSGCGKTTTLRCIAGFEHPQQGRITLGGKAITDAAVGVFTPPHLRRFGMVFQSYAIWPHMTVFENVAYPLKMRGAVPRAEIRDRVLAKLEMVGLAGLDQRYPDRLSGGQQQRVALARAIVMDPLALLFDEPLSNLDAKLRERMRFELLDIQARLAVPAIYVTHDQAEAMVMSRKVIVMKDGRIAQSGSPEDIYDRPASRFVADFVGNCNFIDARVISSVHDGICTVRCALGDLQCMSNQDLVFGQVGLLILRPEKVQVTGEPIAGRNGFTVTVRGRYFMGFYREYLLEIDTVTLRVQTSTAQLFEPGQQIYAYIPAKGCKFIPTN